MILHRKKLSPREGRGASPAPMIDLGSQASSGPLTIMMFGNSFFIRKKTLSIYCDIEIFIHLLHSTLKRNNWDEVYFSKKKAITLSHTLMRKALLFANAS